MWLLDTYFTKRVSKTPSMRIFLNMLQLSAISMAMDVGWPSFLLDAFQVFSFNLAALHPVHACLQVDNPRPSLLTLAMASDRTAPVATPTH